MMEPNDIVMRSLLVIVTTTNPESQRNSNFQPIDKNSVRADVSVENMNISSESSDNLIKQSGEDNMMGQQSANSQILLGESKPVSNIFQQSNVVNQQPQQKQGRSENSLHG